MIKKFFPWIIIKITFILDQLLKIYIVKNFNLYDTKNILGNFFRIKYVENTGMAFGIGSNLEKSIKDVLFTTLTIIVIIIVLYFYKNLKKGQNLAKVAFAFILGGAFGNISDKIFGYIIFRQEIKLFYGGVVDFIDIGIGNYRWPTFNIADIFISLGTIILSILIFYKKENDIFKEKKKILFF